MFLEDDDYLIYNNITNTIIKNLLKNTHQIYKFIKENQIKKILKKNKIINKEIKTETETETFNNFSEYFNNSFQLSQLIFNTKKMKIIFDKYFNTINDKCYNDEYLYLNYLKKFNENTIFLDEYLFCIGIHDSNMTWNKNIEYSREYYLKELSKNFKLEEKWLKKMRELK